ncbi:MAG: 6-carboxytetrahydropterin synthase [Pseudomonadota bacterium]
MIELSQFFTFEAAHRLGVDDDKEHNKRIHGHSFKVEIVVAGEPDPETGILIHFEDLEDICIKYAKADLDHYFLNDIEGLSNPTLENICGWIWDRLVPHIPQLSEVILYRESCGQKCRLFRR